MTKRNASLEWDGLCLMRGKKQVAMVFFEATPTSRAWMTTIDDTEHETIESAKAAISRHFGVATA
jgi:hypothetical protein